jgi:hypothetical protein
MVKLLLFVILVELTKSPTLNPTIISTQGVGVIVGVGVVVIVLVGVLVLVGV